MLLFVCLLNFLEYLNCDIVILFEYKFKYSNVNYLDIIYLNYLSFVYFDFEIINVIWVFFYFCFLGKGGISIMFKKDIEMLIFEIFDIDFFRFIVVELKCIN